jgi:hypothetical protein
MQAEAVPLSGCGVLYRCTGAASDCCLDRSKLNYYDHPYPFTGLRQGERLANKYTPQVYPV